MFPTLVIAVICWTSFGSARVAPIHPSIQLDDSSENMATVPLSAFGESTFTQPRGVITPPFNTTEMRKSLLQGEDGFLHGCVAAISVILVSEIGDKTFFIAVILAMNHSRMLVFTGALAALVLMTALSAFLGQISTVIPRVYVHYVSIALFVIFGLKMLNEGYSMTSAGERSEYDEVQKTIENRESKLTNESMEMGFKPRKNIYLVLWVFVEAFTMTFLAEWGDRSQLTTIVLAARENVFGVIVGAVLGHAACTLLAVLGGRIVAERISVKAVTIIGGVTFLAFAVWAMYMGQGTESPLDTSTEQNLLPQPENAHVDIFFVGSS